MIITRTPLRVSFFGGGTDYPVWYNGNGGAVLSTTINKYCYISCRYLPPFFNYKYRIRYSLREEVQDLSEIQHPAVRECLKYLNISEGIEMVHTSDIPARSGVGSSSAFTIGFLYALYALKGKMVTKRQLAQEAIDLEQNIIKENVGSQDQVAVAFGGLNKIEFKSNNGFDVYPITINKERIDLFHKHLMLFFTGFSRNASDIASEQIKKTPLKKAELQALKEMVDRGVNILNSDSEDIRNFGKLLDEAWAIKRSLTEKISTNEIDNIYEVARKAGAVGGKLLGAGGGGFMLLLAEPELQPKIKEKLKNLVYVPFAFENLGTQVIMYSTQDFY
ncbi:MAG: kinase [Candidatus Omnitrophota bacterium]|jgi:D-glycero-alpha-D-manno-heptose-7-phosphate kinase